MESETLIVVHGAINWPMILAHLCCMLELTLGYVNGGLGNIHRHLRTQKCSPDNTILLSIGAQRRAAFIRIHKQDLLRPSLDCTNIQTQSSTRQRQLLNLRPHSSSISKNFCMLTLHRLLTMMMATYLHSFGKCIQGSP
jgi:hypothetical protein